MLAFHTGETPLFEVSSKQNVSFVLFLNYMQVSKTLIIKKCSTPAKFLFYYLNGIKSPPCSSIIEQYFFGIKELCSTTTNAKRRTTRNRIVHLENMLIFLICTKFAPKSKFGQKENPENRCGIGVFESCRKAEIISSRTEVRDELSSSRTSFFPSFLDRG